MGRTLEIQDSNQTDDSSKVVRKYWTEDEDKILREAIKIHGQKWKAIAEYLEGRNASQCAQRWKRIKPNKEKIRIRWDQEEDEQLKCLVELHSFNWSYIAQFLPHRTGRQIRERFLNHLNPTIKSQEWTKAEDKKIWRMYNQFGTKWAEMAKKMSGRPENMIKNRFYGYIAPKYGNQLHPYYKITVQKRDIEYEQPDLSDCMSQNKLNKFSDMCKSQISVDGFLNREDDQKNCDSKLDTKHDDESQYLEFSEPCLLLKRPCNVFEEGNFSKTIFFDKL